MRGVILRAVCLLVLLPPLARAGSYLVIDSEPGDLVTFGQRDVLVEPRAYFYAERDIWNDTPRQFISVDVEGRYAARVYVGPAPGDPLVAGTYENAQGSDFVDAPYLVVQVAGWCGGMTGRFVANEIATDASVDLTTLSLDFEGQCPAAPGGFAGACVTGGATQLARRPPTPSRATTRIPARPPMRARRDAASGWPPTCAPLQGSARSASAIRSRAPAT